MQFASIVTCTFQDTAVGSSPWLSPSQPEEKQDEDSRDRMSTKYEYINEIFHIFCSACQFLLLPILPDCSRLFPHPIPENYLLILFT